MSKFVNILKSFRADESGAVSSEYAVLLVLIAAALVFAVTFLQQAISGAMQSTANIITGG